MGLGFSDGFKPDDEVYCYGRIIWKDGSCQLFTQKGKDLKNAFHNTYNSMSMQIHFGMDLIDKVEVSSEYLPST